MRAPPRPKGPACSGCGARGETLALGRCEACRQRAAHLAYANTRVRCLVRWCLCCRTIHGGSGYSSHPRGRKLLLEHSYDAGAAIAAMAGLGDSPSISWLRVHLWRCVLNDPGWYPDGYEWDGRHRMTFLQWHVLVALVDAFFWLLELRPGAPPPPSGRAPRACRGDRFTPCGPGQLAERRQWALDHVASAVRRAEIFTARVRERAAEDALGGRAA